MTPVSVTLAIAGLLVPVLALLVYRWGYRAGIESGKRTLEAYKAGMRDDGGCWVKAQPSAQPTSPARE